MSNYKPDNLLGVHCERICRAMLTEKDTEAIEFAEGIYYLAADTVLKAVMLAAESDYLPQVLMKMRADVNEMKARVHTRQIIKLN